MVQCGVSGCLLIVATPIGNLEDITLRALRVLREASLIAAEDTRRTARLLQHYSISTPTTSLHEHNERQKLPLILERIERGDRIALVSDAGTPGLSDPGARLVAAALDRGLRVEPIPGPSAVLAALSSSGFPGDSFTFLGFPPVRGKDRKQWFKDVATESRTAVFFEAPHRIKATMTDLACVLGERPIFVCRELTKLHEEKVKRPTSEALAALSDLRGEFTIVVGPFMATLKTSSQPPDDALVTAEFGRITESKGVSRRAAIASVARKLGLSSREAYGAIERAKAK